MSSLRIDFNSARRFGVVLGYAIFSALNVSRTNWETIDLGVILIIGRNDVPMRLMRGGGVPALLISVHIILPVSALVNIRETQLPVLVRSINAREEALPLFILRKVRKSFNDPRSGFTPDMTCRIAPSLPPASIP